MDGADAVLDPLGAEIGHGVPDCLRAGGLAGVWHAVQSGGAGAIEVLLEHRARKALLRPADPEADKARYIMIKSGRGGHIGPVEPEVGWNVEDPAQLDPMITGGRDAGVLDRFEERLRG
jgi:hypothetical protein